MSYRSGASASSSSTVRMPAMPLPMTTRAGFIGQPSRTDPDLAAVDAGRPAGHGVLRRFQALARAQVEVVLIKGRGDDDALAQVAHQAARQHGGVGVRVEVADGVDAGLRA